MKSLSKKYSSLYRAGWVLVNPDDVRVIDSNERLNEQMEAVGQLNRSLDGYDAGSEDDESSFTGLNPEQVEGLFGESENVFKERMTEAEEFFDETGMEGLAQEILEQAEGRLSAARTECHKMLENAQVEIDMAKRSAVDEGRELGYNEGLAKGIGEIEDMKAGLLAEKAKLRQDYEQLVDELEPRFIELITDIYEQVFSVELNEYAPIVKHLISNTLRASDETKAFVIRVSPDDYDYIIARREEIKENAATGEASIEIIKDQTLTSGACLIETTGGIFDAGFDTQLTGLNKKLRLLSYEK